MQSHLEKYDESEKFLMGMMSLAVLGCFLILLYSSQFWANGQFFCILGVGLLVAGAALFCGFLLGFIFAIPRMGEKGKAAADPPKDSHPTPSTAPREAMPFNANLVEISDWLTKIIVGVGLVELHSISAKLGQLSYDLAPGLMFAPGAEDRLIGQTAGLAILIYYFTGGFLAGYIWTTINFQRYLRDVIDQLKQQNSTLQRQINAQTAVLCLLAEASINAGQLDKAMTYIDGAIENVPPNGFFEMAKARILKRQAVKADPPDRDKLFKAIACADQAITLLPDKGEPADNKACYQALLGMKSDMLENLKSAFRLNPGLRQIAREDDDLTSFRQDADFVNLITRE